tara:strand:- start:4945 stop:8109 length:3165 start_codon:yes stop_codon:yes gene_type:complete
MTDVDFIRLRANLGQLRKDLQTARKMAEKQATIKADIRIGKPAIEREAVAAAKAFQSHFAKPLALRLDRAALHKQISAFKAGDVKLRIDQAGWMGQVTQARGALRVLTGQPHIVRIRADSSDANSQISWTGQRLRRELGTHTLRIRGQSDLAGVRAEVERLHRQIRNTPTMRVRGGVTGGGVAGSNQGGFFTGNAGRFLGGAGVAGFLGGGRGTQLGAGLGAMAGGPAGGIAGGVLGASADATVGQASAGVTDIAQLTRVENTLSIILKDGDKATKLMKELEAIDLQLPVDMGLLADATVKLAGAGFDPNSITKNLGSILDAGAVSPEGVNEGTSRIVRAMSQIKAKGRLQAEELLQLQEIGLPVNRILSEQFGGRSIDSITKASQAGDIPVDEILNKLIAGFEQNFGGALKKQSEDLLGLAGQIQEKWAAIRREIAEPLFQPLEEALRDLNNAIEAGKFDDLKEALKGAAMAAVDLTKSAAGFVSNVIEADAGGEVKGVGGFVGAENKKLFDFYDSIFKSIAPSDQTGGPSFKTFKGFIGEKDADFSAESTPIQKQLAQGFIDQVGDAKTRTFLQDAKDSVLSGNASDEQNAGLQRFFRTGRFPTLPDGFSHLPPQGAEEFAGPAPANDSSEFSGGTANPTQYTAPGGYAAIQNESGEFDISKDGKPTGKTFPESWLKNNANWNPADASDNALTGPIAGESPALSTIAGTIPLDGPTISDPTTVDVQRFDAAMGDARKAAGLPPMPTSKPDESLVSTPAPPAADPARSDEAKREKIAELESQAAEARKAADEANDNPTKSALKYKAEALQLESELQQNLVLPDGLTDSEKEIELARRKAENLKQQSDALARNARTVASMSDGEKAALSQNFAGTVSAPNAIDGGAGLFEATKRAENLRSQSKEMRDTGDKAEIKANREKGAITTGKLKEAASSFWSDFVRKAGATDKDSADELKRRYQPEVKTTENADGTVRNTVTLKEIANKFSRGPSQSVEFSGLNRMMQANADQARQSQEQRKIRELTEKANARFDQMAGSLDSIDGKTKGDNIAVVAEG